MAHKYLEARGVTLDYPVYNLSARSIRSSLFSGIVGGKLYRQHDTPIVRALSDVSFRIDEGDRLALIGHNGSGKTTLLKVIAGIYEPAIGYVESSGVITSTIAHGAGVDFEATGLDNIWSMARMRMVSRKTVASKLDSIIEFSGLADFMQLPVRTYSAGMLSRLMFAVTTAFEPEILVLDEWIGAGDADFAEKAAERMASFVDRASIVVLATHNEAIVRRAFNKVCVLEHGRLIYFGDPTAWYDREKTEPAPFHALA